MASITAFITTLTIFFQCLFGIGGLGFGKVVLKLEKDAYPVATEKIEATLYNCTGKPIVVAPYAYSLERLEAGGWAPVAWKDSVIIPVAMFLLPPFQSVSKSFHLTDYDPLPAGRYRLTASGSVYAEFQLVSGMDITFTGFPKEFADFLFSLQWNNTVELLPENKPVYQRLISEPLALLFHGLAQTAVSVSDTLVTRPSKCVSTMYSDMRFSRNTPLKAYMYIRFREPCGEKDILGLYFDMGCDYYSYGIRIYKQSSAGMARVRAFAAAHEQAFARELAGMQALGLEIKGEAFARDHFPGTQNAALKALLNSRSFYIGRDRPVSEVVFSGALHAEICNAYEGLRGLYLLLKQALYGGEKFT